MGPLWWLLLLTLTVNVVESALLLSCYVLDVWTESKFLPTLFSSVALPSLSSCVLKLLLSGSPDWVAEC